MSSADIMIFLAIKKHLLPRPARGILAYATTTLASLPGLALKVLLTFYYYSTFRKSKQHFI
jgi:hypothetical protein